MFEHRDLYPILFSYLTQREIATTALVSKALYQEHRNYLSTTPFYYIHSDCSLFNAIKNDYIISINASYRKGWYFHDYCFQEGMQYTDGKWYAYG